MWPILVPFYRSLALCLLALIRDSTSRSLLSVSFSCEASAALRDAEASFLGRKPSKEGRRWEEKIQLVGNTEKNV